MNAKECEPKKVQSKVKKIMTWNFFKPWMVVSALDGIFYETLKKNLGKLADSKSQNMSASILNSIKNCSSLYR